MSEPLPAAPFNPNNGIKPIEPLKPVSTEVQPHEPRAGDEPHDAGSVLRDNRVEIDLRLHVANTLVDLRKLQYEPLLHSQNITTASNPADALRFTSEELLGGLVVVVLGTTFFDAGDWATTLTAGGALVVDKQVGLRQRTVDRLSFVVVGGNMTEQEYKLLGKLPEYVRIIDENTLLHVLYVLGLSMPYMLDTALIARAEMEAGVSQNAAYSWLVAQQQPQLSPNLPQHPMAPATDNSFMGNFSAGDFIYDSSDDDDDMMDVDMGLDEDEDDSR